MLAKDNDYLSYGTVFLKMLKLLTVGPVTTLLPPLVNMITTKTYPADLTCTSRKIYELPVLETDDKCDILIPVISRPAQIFQPRYASCASANRSAMMYLIIIIVNHSAP